MISPKLFAEVKKKLGMGEDRKPDKWRISKQSLICCGYFSNEQINIGATANDIAVAQKITKVDHEIKMD